MTDAGIEIKEGSEAAVGTEVGKRSAPVARTEIKKRPETAAGTEVGKRTGTGTDKRRQDTYRFRDFFAGIRRPKQIQHFGWDDKLL